MKKSAPRSVSRVYAELIRPNGFLWFGLYCLELILGRWGAPVECLRRRFEVTAELPGTHSVESNRRIWGGFDWSCRGEEWTLSEPWKRSVVENVLKAHLPPDPESILEIGPGGGRWTDVLREVCVTLHVVDIVEETLAECRGRFEDAENIRYWLGDGKTLPFISSDTIDFVWSFDVFVHISVPDTASYVQEFRRVMKPGGIGLIHHSGTGEHEEGWRSDLSGERMKNIVRSSGLEVVRQLTSWGEGETDDLGSPNDMITIFRKPSF